MTYKKLIPDKWYLVVFPLSTKVGDQGEKRRAKREFYGPFDEYFNVELGPNITLQRLGFEIIDEEAGSIWGKHNSADRTIWVQFRKGDWINNRSFPGKKNGNYEERRAYELMPLVKSADFVIDIHSTTSQLKDALIVTKLNKKMLEYVKIIQPRRVLLMNVVKNKDLLSYAKAGVAFEYGGDKDPVVLKKIVNGIKSLFAYFGIISIASKKIKINTTFFKVYKSVLKPEGAKLDKKIKNYNPIKKGQTYAILGDKKIKAKNDFYPVLFGEKNYEDIFGFAARKIK